MAPKAAQTPEAIRRAELAPLVAFLRSNCPCRQGILELDQHGDQRIMYFRGGLRVRAKPLRDSGRGYASCRPDAPLSFFRALVLANPASPQAPCSWTS
jgi:hypothetical protein